MGQALEPGDRKLSALVQTAAPFAASGAKARKERSPVLGAVGPACLYVVILLVLPFIYLVYLSLQEGGHGADQTAALSLANYVEIFTSRIYLESLWGTLQLGVAVTALTLLIGYPVAYYIAQSGSRFAMFTMAVIILPLFVSVVVRSFGWMILLGRQGNVNRMLMGLGFTDKPLQLLYTPGAVTVGLVHILAPLMILPIASVLRGLDPALREAASSLGASRAKVFWTVTLPLSLPGVAAGCVLVLAHVIAAFVLPALIGSDRVKLMATMIYQQVMTANNLPLGAALAVVMVVATFALLALAGFIARRHRV
ncbi:ABC transporter permease [Bosea caraganae]|uniref:ABC transporter permease n=1 Tax=Bosea caraganae TaxID=2763117 RepID=A0A370LCV5_9HYPH|nr:ABC transporter permease [Bosea caraganae]RDJ29761.1 ABC transporter permease [Bosea caraganae]